MEKASGPSEIRVLGALFLFLPTCPPRRVLTDLLGYPFGLAKWQPDWEAGHQKLRQLPRKQAPSPAQLHVDRFFWDVSSLPQLRAPFEIYIIPPRKEELYTVHTEHHATRKTAILRHSLRQPQ